MKSLLIGNGAREHAIAEQMCKSSDLYAFMGANNPGIAKLAKEFQIGKVTDNQAIVEFAKKVSPDYVFVGPENPLANGLANKLEGAGFKVAGPIQELAKLEADKGFCRELLSEKIPEGCPKFVICNDVDIAMEAIDEFDTEIVVKPAGLTGGKGVKVQGQQLKDLDEVREYAKEVIEQKIGGSPYVVLEEKLVGEEFSFQAFTDGSNLVGMPLAQDHKHAFENDTGPMTGGMGSYSDSNHLLPFVSNSDFEKALDMMRKTVRAVKEKTGLEYKGILYGGFMLTKNGLKILEYNVRLGDPEAMNVLPLLKTDFSEICLSILDGNLSNNIEFENKASVCKYLVPKGYPTNPESGAEISIDENQIKSFGAQLHYASIDQRDTKLYTSTSRSFSITGFADTIEQAESIAQKAISTVESDKLFYRPDIGTKALIEKRIKHMQELSG